MNCDKSKSEMVTRYAVCLAIDTFLDEVGKRNFYYHIWEGIYAVWLIAIDTYRGSNSVAGNVYVKR